MTSAGFNCDRLQETGTTMDQTWRISANWEQGATAMDIFTQAVGKATGNMQKSRKSRSDDGLLKDTWACLWRKRARR